MERHKTVGAYIEHHEQWQEALIRLRELLLTTDLEETVKWGAPVYALNGKNIVGIGAFKSYVGLWFYQGALLSDAKGKLMNAQEGVTKALRQWRFNGVDEMDDALILTYVKEAIANQQAGKEIKPTRKPLVVPDELKAALQKHLKAKQHYEAMGLTKQREYADYISDAKREATKQKRLEKILPMIADNKGLYDKYKNC